MPTDHPDTAPSDLAPAARGTAIRSAEVLVTSPDRNFVTLRITTEDGVVGLGDATLNGRELSVASYLSDHVVPLLLGRDAHRIEDTWQFLYRSAYWRRGPVTMAAIAAVDVALWDIKAKVAGLPLYQLLGGASRTGIMAYGHASGRDLPELFDSIRHAPGAGLPLHPGADLRPGHRRRLRGGRAAVVVGPLRLRARPARSPAGRGGLGHPRVPAAHPDRVRGRAQRVRPRGPAAARRAPPDDPDPGGAPGQGPRAVRPVLARGLHARRRTRRRCGWSGSTPPRRWPSARCSTPCGTTRRWSASSSSTTSAPP